MMKIMVAVFVLSLSIVIHGATIVSTSEVSPSEVSPTATSSSYTKLPTPTPQLVNDEELDASYERKFFNPQSMKFVTVKDGNLFADASPTDGTIFEVERYINSNETDTYYYKLRIVDTNEYVYFAPNRTLQVGIPTEDYASSFTRYRKISLDRRTIGYAYKNNKHDCYLGFFKNEGFCSQKKHYLIEKSSNIEQNYG